MTPLNFSWLIENEVAGHSGPLGHNDLLWLFQKGIRALVRMSENPKVSADEIRRLGMDDLHEPVADFTAPSQPQLERMVNFILESVWNGKPVGVSCGAGIGRTGTVLACYLAKRNLSAKGLIVQVRRKRPGAVETMGQLEAVEQYLSHIFGQSETTGDNDDCILQRLKDIAKERCYGRGFDHADAVTKLYVDMYSGMVKLRLFPQTPRDLLLLKASGYLHDVGVPPEEKHNVNGFKWLKERFDRRDAQGILSEAEMSIVLYCILWHKGDDFEERPEVKLERDALQRARRLAGILRIADGLCYPDGRPTQNASVSEEESTLLVEACPSRKGSSLSTQVAKANEKKNLLVQVLTTVPETDIREVEIRRCSHADCS